MSETLKEQLGKAVLANEPWLSEELPFNFTATGFLGAKRQGMLSNPLLLKGAVSSAMTSSSDIREFRAHKARVRQTGSIRGSKRQERPLPKVFNPETIFGRPHEYESIEALTSYSYQRQWLLDNIEGMLKKDVKIDYTKVRPTRASMLRPQVMGSSLQRQPWRSPQFIIKARPHLSTFRAEKPLLDAQKFQELDSQGREGQTGQGIPKNTPHEHPLPPMKGKCSAQFPCA